MSKGKTRIAWHPAFCSAMELELRENKAQLTFEREYPLSKEPLRIDLLIIEKQQDVHIQNEIGKIFRRFNIMEYKSPEDSMQLDDYFKVVGYVSLYKSEGTNPEDRLFSDLTLTMLRDRKPMKLLEQLQDCGATVCNETPGIYLVENAPLRVPTQIVVSGELTPENHRFLRLLTNQLTKEDVIGFLDSSAVLTERSDRQNAEAVVHVSAIANDEVYDDLRRESRMSDVLRNLLREDFDEKDRQIEEANRKAEAEKQKAEVEKQKAEVEKQKAEAANLKAEAEKLIAEAANQKAEAANQKAEAANQKAEAANQKAETANQRAETARKSMMSNFAATVKTLMDMCNLDFKHAAEAARVPAELIPIVESML